MNDQLKKFMENNQKEVTEAPKIEKKPSQSQAQAPENADEPNTQTLELTKKRSSAAKREVSDKK